MKTSCLRLKLVELNFFASFNADDQRKTYVSNVSKKKKSEMDIQISTIIFRSQNVFRSLLLPHCIHQFPLPIFTLSTIRVRNSWNSKIATSLHVCIVIRTTALSSFWRNTRLITFPCSYRNSSCTFNFIRNQHVSVSRFPHCNLIY